jgi:stage II sporulation protein D
MLFRILIIFSIPLVFFNSLEASRKSIRINILSKYQLKEITVKGCGRMSLSSAVLELNNDPVSIFSSGDKIGITYKGINYYDESIKIYSSESNLNKFLKIYYLKNTKREYTGTVEIQNKTGILEIINETPLEDYVHSAALAELGDITRGLKHEETSELVSAMEIAGRSYVLHNKRKHEDTNYNICDLTHCVYYAGIIDKGESLTPGITLTGSDGEILQAYFHSTCGGVLSSPEIFWDAPCQKDYRVGEDKTGSRSLCSGSPHYEWEAAVSYDDVCAIIGYKNCGNLTAEYSEGRVIRLGFIAENEKHHIRIARFLSAAGKRLGWNVIKSNLFTVSISGNTKTVFVFKGRGLGHGIGMCQWGSRELAIMGKSFEEILKHYYPGAVIRNGY